MAKKTLTQLIAENITLDRVNILEEAENKYKVEYQNKTYEVFKSTKTSFSINGSSDYSLEMKQVFEQCLVPETEIFQDEKVPKEFKEIMMFHEIRELEYKEASLGNAHERALNDEMLYVIKFFDEKTLRDYLKFAKKYRIKFKKNEKQSKSVENKSLIELFADWGCSVFDWAGFEELYKRAEETIGNKNVDAKEINLLKFLTRIDLKGTWQLGTNHQIIPFYCAAINRIPERYGEINIKLPPTVVQDYITLKSKISEEPLNETELNRLKESFYLLKRKNVKIEYEDGKFLEF